ncbi:hypothetical protein CR513_47480, partial [Mucuna pruriens]
MVTMFIDTLLSPYYDKVVGSVASNFTDLMVVGERIELSIRPPVKEKERRSQCYADRARLPIREMDHFLVSNLVQCRSRVDGYQRQLTTDSVRSSITAMSRRMSSRHSRASTTRREKAAQNADPDPNDLYRTAPSAIGTKAYGNSSSQNPSSPIPEKL